ncbi:UPF0079 domain containing protein [Sulfitobacter noctilucicola]|nr:tRNA (adenosine(37)-N6)-threonylcarbamoyltransferase complex ATPase subunit type 1 TsaE [Sulfitobacter noctilucicola]KIN62846.1 UPF0079 domain containing protein [Sulfitobacter noctilucicola]
MVIRSYKTNLKSADETADFAKDLSTVLTGGDVILLTGDVGAGKTHFARSLIKNMLGRDEDVPSPTFTLVQTYPCGDVDIWHADLYRLTSLYEIEELGLVDAFETEICLVEWPDRLGPLAPTHALNITLGSGEDDESRTLDATWSDPRWDMKLKVWE